MRRKTQRAAAAGGSNTADPGDRRVDCVDHEPIDVTDVEGDGDVADRLGDTIGDLGHVGAVVDPGARSEHGDATERDEGERQRREFVSG